jgi:hypothetical protein
VKAVDHGGYLAETDYMEVHGRYLLHQDFAGARLPTSPSAVTLWVGLNASPDWALRLYPGTHRLGLLCHTWLDLDDARLGAFGSPVELTAQPGRAVLFNALLLHGTGAPGPGRRVSCDLRFFPLCGFLPSSVHGLVPDPLAEVTRRLSHRVDASLDAPLLEQAAFLGRGGPVEDSPPYSVLNWINYLRVLVGGNPDAARPHLERFVNESRGVDPASVFVGKFHGHPLVEETLRSARACIERDASTADLARLDAVIARAGGVRA